MRAYAEPTICMPWRFATVVAAILALLGTGCTPSTLTIAVRTANTTADLMDAAQTVLADTYKAEQIAAVDAASSADGAKAAVAAIRARYAPAWAAHRAARHTWLSFAATIEGRKLGHYTDTEIASWLPRIAKAHAELARAVEAIAGEPKQ